MTWHSKNGIESWQNNIVFFFKNSHSGKQLNHKSQVKKQPFKILPHKKQKELRKTQQQKPALRESNIF
jgi:hypothetical protein